MLKFFKRSLSVVLALSVIMTMMICAFTVVSADTDRIQWVSFDDGLGVVFESPANPPYTVPGLEGKNAICADIKDGQMIMYLHNDGNGKDITGAKYITFDMYLSKPINVSTITDANFNVSSTMNNWSEGGSFSTAGSIKNFVDWTHVGWQNVTLQIQQDTNENFSISNLVCGRFYVLSSDFQDVTVAFDDLCFCTDAGKATNDKINVAKEAIVAIRAIPAIDELTLEDESTVVAARTAVNAIEQGFESWVSTDDMKALTDAEAKIVELKASLVDISMKNMDGLSGYTGSYNGTPALETANKVEGTGAWKFDVSGRNNAKMIIYGNNEGGGNNTDSVKTTDISSAINKDGEFYLTFDMYITNTAMITKSRFVVGVGTKSQVVTGIAADKTALQAFFRASNPTDSFASCVAGGQLKNGWNHFAIKYVATADSKYASNKSVPFATGWDPTQLWLVQFFCDGFNATDSADGYFLFDDIRVMSTDAYDAKYAGKCAAKDVNLEIQALPAVDNLVLGDAKKVATAREDFNKLDETSKPIVTTANLQKLVAAEEKIEELKKQEEGNVVDISMKNLDALSGYTGNYTGVSSEKSDYVEGTGAWKFDVSGRNNAKMIIYGNNEGGGTNTDVKTTDISSAINEDGEFYLTFDMYVTNKAMLTKNRFVVGVGTKSQVVTGIAADKTALQAFFRASNPTDTFDSCVAGGELKNGWNHFAIKYIAAAGSKYANNNSVPFATGWDPTQLWIIQFFCDGFTAADSADGYFLFDDIRVMSTDAYNKLYAGQLEVKEVIKAINHLSDEASIAAAKEAYDKLTPEQQAKVTNYEILKKALDTRVLDLQVKSFDSTAKIIVASGNLATSKILDNNITEGKGSWRSDWIDPIYNEPGKLYFSVMQLGDLDVSEYEYLTFDMYVSGFEYNQSGSDCSVSFGSSSDAGQWSSNDLGVIRKELVNVCKDLEPGWNHLVIPLKDDSGAALSIKNLNVIGIGFEDRIRFTTENPFVIIDDMRFINGNALTMNADRNIAKDLVSTISGLTVENVDEIERAEADYQQLSDNQKAFVFNYDKLNELRLAPEQAQAVINEINALSTEQKPVPTYADAEAIKQAEADYQKLSATAKALVTNYETLEGYLAMLAAEEKAAADVDEEIAQLPAVDDVQLSNETAIETAKKHYNDLADDTKPLVKNVEILNSVVAKLEELKAAASDQEKADAVIAEIDKLPDPEDVVVSDEEAIALVEKMFNELTPDQKLLVTNAQKLVDVRAAVEQGKLDKAEADAFAADVASLPDPVTAEYEQIVADLRARYNAFTDGVKFYIDESVVKALEDAELAVATDKKDIADAKEVSDAIDELPAPSEVTIEDDAAVMAAKADYDALSDNAKSKIDPAKIEKLLADLKKLVPLKPIDMQFRGLNHFGSDLAVVSGSGAFYQEKENILEGTKAAGISWTGGADQLFVYIYAYNQVWTDTNIDGAINLYVPTDKQIYLTFDFYCNDVDVIKSFTGDAGISIDDTQHVNAWGYSAGRTANANVMRDAFSSIENGWNHIAIPITYTNDKLGTFINVAAFRLHFIGLKITEEFKVIVDDVRFMDQSAFEQILPMRSAAKNITVDIRALNEQSTLADYARIQNAYKSLDAEYQAIVLGYDKFLEDFNTKFSEDINAAKAVDEMIEALPATEGLTLDNENDVIAARAAYTALTDNQKLLVLNLAILEAAEKKIADLKAAGAVDAKIAALPAVDELTLEDEVDVLLARGAYETLTNDQKALVENLAVLEAAEAKIQELKDIAAAKAVDDQIAKLPSIEELSLSDEEAVIAARAAFTALTDNQKLLVNNLEILESAERKIKELKDFADAQVVENQISELPAVDELTLENEAEVIAARKAFDALTDDQKLLVNNLAVLESAEAKILELNTEVASAVVNAISELPESGEVYYTDALAIEKARDSFNKLSDSQKALVGNKQKLTDAEEALAQLPVPDEGDIDFDGTVTAHDALVILQYSIQKVELSNYQKNLCTFGIEGDITAANALHALQMSIGLVPNEE